jgi:hypothetical protein
MDAQLIALCRPIALHRLADCLHSDMFHRPGLSPSLYSPLRRKLSSVLSRRTIPEVYCHCHVGQALDGAASCRARSSSTACSRRRSWFPTSLLCIRGRFHVRKHRKASARCALAWDDPVAASLSSLKFFAHPPCLHTQFARVSPFGCARLCCRLLLLMPPTVFLTSIAHTRTKPTGRPARQA